MGCCTKFCTSTVRQHVAAIGVGHGALGLGVLLAWTSIAVSQMNSQLAFGQISLSTAAWIGNVTLLGAILGAIPAGIFLDKFGRRVCILVSSVPIAIGWIIIVFANSLGILYLGRFITGLSLGALSVVLPIYLTEVAESRIRGFMGCSFLQHVGGGALFVTIAGEVIGWNWKLLVYKSLPVIVLVIIATYFLPESPIYYFNIGQRQKGSDALNWFRVTSSSESVEAEIKEIEDSAVDAFNSNHYKISWSFSNPITKQIGIPGILMFLQQCTCALQVILGTVSITEEHIFGESQSKMLVSLIATVTTFVSINISARIVDRVGRRPLLLLSCIVMTLALLALGLSLFYQNETQVTENAKWIRLVSFTLYISGFGLGLGPISWLMMAELVPGTSKGVWVAVVTLFNWVPAFVIGMYFRLFIVWLTLPGFLWACAAVSISAAIFSYLYVPETTNKSLSETQSLFEDTLKFEYPI